MKDRTKYAPPGINRSNFLLEEKKILVVIDEALSRWAGEFQPGKSIEGVPALFIQAGARLRDFNHAEWNIDKILGEIRLEVEIMMEDLVSPDSRYGRPVERGEGYSWKWGGLVEYSDSYGSLYWQGVFMCARWSDWTPDDETLKICPFLGSNV